MSLYDDLGVEKNASSEDVKKAYRKKAQKLHPDKASGDPQKFQVVQYAYDVLGDEARRKRYDETGIDEKTPQVKVMAMQNIAGMFMQILNSGVDFETINVVERLKLMVVDGKKKADQTIAKITKDIARFERAKKKLKYKGKDKSFLMNVLEIAIRDAKLEIGNAEKVKEIGAEMDALLKSHDWEVQVAGATEDPFKQFLYLKETGL